MSFSPPFHPEDAATAAAMLAFAAREHVRIVPRGNGTKPAVAAPTDALLLSTSRLTSGLSHWAGDLVATIPAGCTLQEANSVLARAGQWIPLDPPHAARATIGGIVASNDSGPRRFGFGAPRESIIGIEVALTTGGVARAGGRVVKNVAGYDLGRLFCGSRGALGLITAVTFKLAPRAAASRTVVAQYERPEQAQAAALEIARSPSLTPTTIEFISSPARLLVRFETTNRAAESMAGAAASVLSTEGAGVAILGGDEESAVWAAHQAIESRADGLEVSAAVLPASGATLLQQMDPVSTACDVSVAVTGRAALGLFRIRFTGTPDALARAATMTGDVATRLQGHARITAGDTSAGARAMPPADAGPAVAVAYAVKQRFDPAGVLPWPWHGASAETAHT